MSRLSLRIRIAAVVSCAVIFGNGWSAMQTDLPVAQPAAIESSQLFKSAADGCTSQATLFDPALGAAKEIVAARNLSPICSYLEKCCTENSANAQRCRGVLAKRGC